MSLVQIVMELDSMNYEEYIKIKKLFFIYIFPKDQLWELD